MTRSDEREGHGPVTSSAYLRTLALLLMLLAMQLSGQAQEESAGRHNTTPNVDPYFGLLTTDVAIDVPPFRSLTPKLELQYTSTTHNGWLCAGWELVGFSTIERTGVNRGAPRYDTSDIYILDGQELVASTALGGTHCTKVQSYGRIAYDSGSRSWTIRDTAGTRAIYEPLLLTSGGILRWHITSLVDPRGNIVLYRYWHDTTMDCYPDLIIYNGSVIDCHWELRPDPIRYATSVSPLMERRYRLKTLAITTGGNKLRAYDLRYTTSPSGTSMLEQVTLYGSDHVLDASGAVVGGTNLPPSTFTWQSRTRDPDFEVVSTSGLELADEGVLSNRNRYQCDFDGDGRDDLCKLGNSATRISYGTSQGFTAPIRYSGQFDARENPAILGDFNGDGKTDILATPKELMSPPPNPDDS